ncbi:hypothetical protein DH86_00002815, partial [Scytalidium sp. 3C]
MSLFDNETESTLLGERPSPINYFISVIKFSQILGQRNMLAIKFHHLRTLMHRPYLCLAWLQQHNPALMALVEGAHDQVSALERVCVDEAQQTAHLLHNVTDEKS